MKSSDKLTKEQILAALSRLNELLREKEVMGEICIFGGAAMVLAFDARESTRDVDAIFAPKQDVILSAEQVAQEFGFEIDWLNEGVKG
jgi:predicted nucleotidyltransferase